MSSDYVCYTSTSRATEEADEVGLLKLILKLRDVLVTLPTVNLSRRAYAYRAAVAAASAPAGASPSAGGGASGAGSCGLGTASGADGADAASEAVRPPPAASPWVQPRQPVRVMLLDLACGTGSVSYMARCRFTKSMLPWFHLVGNIMVDNDADVAATYFLRPSQADAQAGTLLPDNVLLLGPGNNSGLGSNSSSNQGRVAAAAAAGGDLNSPVVRLLLVEWVSRRLGLCDVVLITYGHPCQVHSQVRANCRPSPEQVQASMSLLRRVLRMALQLKKTAAAARHAPRVLMVLENPQSSWDLSLQQCIARDDKVIRSMQQLGIDWQQPSRQHWSQYSNHYPRKPTLVWNNLGGCLGDVVCPDSRRERVDTYLDTAAARHGRWKQRVTVANINELRAQQGVDAAAGGTKGLSQLRAAWPGGFVMHLFCALGSVICGRQQPG
eukprot:gene8382-8566_t